MSLSARDVSSSVPDFVCKFRVENLASKVSGIAVLRSSLDAPIFTVLLS